MSSYKWRVMMPTGSVPVGKTKVVMGVMSDTGFRGESAFPQMDKKQALAAWTILNMPNEKFKEIETMLEKNNVI